jgi:glycosyltransferase involved in cell wall biosynthesis
MESLLAQTASCEIVVVDGNSTDGTREILKEFPVKLVTAPEKDSYGISRNLGIKHSSARVILFMDADDHAEPTWAEVLLKHFEGNSNVGIVNVPRKVVSFEGWFMKTLEYEYASQARPEAKSVPSWTSVTTKGTAWLKRAIIEAGGFDDSMFFGTEDKDLSYRIWKLGYSVEEEPLARITVTPVGGARNFLKDKYWRAGVGHGYMRRKFGLYKPPISGIASVVFVIAGLILLFSLRDPFFALASFVLAILVSKSVIQEGLRLSASGVPLPSSIAFTLVKWSSRVIEFFGFFIGYLFYPPADNDHSPFEPKGREALPHAKD